MDYKQMWYELKGEVLNTPEDWKDAKAKQIFLGLMEKIEIKEWVRQSSEAKKHILSRKGIRRIRKRVKRIVEKNLNRNVPVSMIISCWKSWRPLQD